MTRSAGAPPSRRASDGRGPPAEAVRAERRDALRARADGPAGSSRRSLTTILAFLIGGLVVLATTGKNPLTVYQAIFNGTGLNWFFHVGNYEATDPVHGRARFGSRGTPTSSRGARTSSRRCSLTSPLILTGPRGRVRVPLRDVQHRRPGPVPRRHDLRASGSARRSAACPGSCTSCSCVVAGGARRRAVAGHRRDPEGDRRAPTR